MRNPTRLPTEILLRRRGEKSKRCLSTKSVVTRRCAETLDCTDSCCWSNPNNRESRFVSISFNNNNNNNYYYCYCFISYRDRDCDQSRSRLIAIVRILIFTLNLLFSERFRKPFRNISSQKGFGKVSSHLNSNGTAQMKSKHDLYVNSTYGSKYYSVAYCCVRKNNMIATATTIYLII